MDPTKEWIEEAKKKYGKIFKAVVSGDTYVYRQLLRPEYNTINAEIQPEMTPQGPVLTPEQTRKMEEVICSTCVIWPENYKDISIPAGVPSVLSTFISDISGYRVETAPEEL